MKTTRIGDWSVCPTPDGQGLAIKCRRPDGTWLPGEIILRHDPQWFSVNVYADDQNPEPKVVNLYKYEDLK